MGGGTSGTSPWRSGGIGRSTGGGAGSCDVPAVPAFGTGPGGGAGTFGQPLATATSIVRAMRRRIIIESM